MSLPIQINCSSSSQNNVEQQINTSTNSLISSFQSSPFNLIYADPDSTSTTTTCCNNTSTSNTPIPFIELANLQLWEKFAKVQNEMVVTRPGRKMFPKLELHLHNLDPKEQYTLLLHMQKVDNLRYKYQAGGWSAAGHDGDNGIQQSNSVQHHEGWNKGEFWTSQEYVSFERVKLTNKESQQGGNSMISLSSMAKYQPVIRLYKYLSRPVIVADFRPPQCQFIAVTAYQSEAVTKLKVEHNPFAKGFREGSSRKRTLSPSIPNGSPYQPPLFISNQFPSIFPLPQQQAQQSIAASAYINLMQNMVQQYNQQQLNKQHQQQQASPPQFPSFSPVNIFGQHQQQPNFNQLQMRAMLGAMGIFNGVGGFPFTSDHQSLPFSFQLPTTTKPCKTAISQDDKEIDTTPTKSKRAKISTPTSQNSLQSSLIGGNPCKITNINKTLMADNKIPG